MIARAGKGIVVTGGRSGKGLATAKQPWPLGAEVVVASRSREKLDAALRHVAARTENVDVRDEIELAQLFQRVGPFDHLVTAAADATLGAFKDLPGDDTRALVESRL